MDEFDDIDAALSTPAVPEGAELPVEPEIGAEPDSTYDFSQLPQVVAKNQATLAANGIPVAPPAAPVQLMDDLELQDLGQELELQQKYGGTTGEIAAAALGAADTAGFSVPGRLLDKLGILSAKEQKEYRDRNPTADVLGTGLGIIGPLLIGNPSGLIGKGVTAGTQATLKAGTAAEKTAAEILTKVVGDSATQGALKSVIRKSIEKSAQGAAEGAVQGFNSLLREDALGDAELNAEGLMSHVGMGVLYGGLANAGLNLAGTGLKAATKVVGAKGGLFDKAFSKFLDPAKAAEELSALPASKIAKMKSTAAGQEFLDNLPEWYTKEVGLSVLGDDAAKVVEKVRALEAKSGKQIESLLTQIDEKAASQVAEAPLSKVQELSKIADDIQSKYVEPNMTLDPRTGRWKSLESFRAQNIRIQKIIQDIRTVARQEGPLTGAGLTKLKRQMDALAKGFYERGAGAAPSAYEKAAFKARDLINNLGKKYAESIDTTLAAELARANKNAYYAKTVLPSLARKASKDTNLIGFRDSLVAASGFLTGHEVLGTAIIGTKKLLESDVRRRAVILSGIERSNLAVAGKIKDAAANFMKKTGPKARAASIYSLINSAVAQKREPGKPAEAPKTRLEAYNNATTNLSQLVVKSDELLNKSIKASAAVAVGAPKTAEIMGQRAIAAAQFLHSKMPKRPYEASFITGAEKPYQPSSMELAKFERYVQVIDSPLSVLHDLEAGTLTREHVEALRTVYPAIYSQIQQDLLEQLRDKSELDLSYAKRVQISMLFGIAGDASLLGMNIAQLQSSFAQPQEAQPAQAGGPVTPTQGQQLGQASRAATGTDAFLMRKQGR